MDLNRQSLLEFLNREAMAKGDMKERAQLLSRHNPQCLVAGSVVQVEVMVNQTTRQRVSYTGTLIAVRRKGMGSNIVILFEVMGMLTTMTFPVFSPMVTAINVVRRTQARRSKLYYLERQTDLRYPVSESALQDVIQADFYARNPNAGENARVPRIQQGMSGLQAANKITAASVEEAAAKARRQ